MKKILLIVLFITGVCFGQTYELAEEFYENGLPKVIKTFKESNDKYELVKSINVYENGQKKEEKTYKGVNRYGVPIKDGIWTWWHENGQKKSKRTYKDGEADGLVTMWYENGQKKQEGTWKDGNIVGIWTSWNENGEMEGKVTILEYLINEATAEKAAAEARTKELAAELAVAWSKKGEEDWEGTILKYLVKEATAEKVAAELAFAEKAAREKAAINKTAKEKEDRIKAARKKSARKKAARKKAARKKAVREKMAAEKAKAEAEKDKAEARAKKLAVKLASDCLKIFDLSQELYKSGKHQETMDILETTLRMEGCDEEINSKAQYYIGWTYGNKLFDMDAARAEYLKGANNYTSNLKYVEKCVEKLALYKKNDEAEVVYKAGDFAKAAALREEVGLTKGCDRVLAAKNLYQAGYIHQKRLNNNAKAKTLYEAVVISFSGSGYVDRAKQKLATL